MNLFLLFVLQLRSILTCIYEVSKMLFLQNEHWGQQGLAVSVSFGNADLSEQDSIVNIVRKADKLMYMNKFEKSIVRSSNG